MLHLYKVGPLPLLNGVMPFNPYLHGPFQEIGVSPGLGNSIELRPTKGGPRTSPHLVQGFGGTHRVYPWSDKGSDKGFFPWYFPIKWGIFPIWRPRILKITVGSWLLRWFQGAFIRLVWLPGTFHFWWMFYGRWLLTSTALILQAILWDESSSMVRDPAFASKSSAVVDWNINGNVAC